MRHFKETIQLLEGSSFYYIIIIGMDSRYSYVSPNYDNNFALLEGTLLGKPFHITLHPDDIKICSEVGGLCFENPGKLLPATLRKHDGKGGFVFTQWELKALFDEQGIPDGIFGIGYNTTEFESARTELVTAKTEIGDKTEKLHEIGFIQSHVIRKPLANIIGLSKVFTTMNTNPDMHQINQMLMESANELDTVINNIVNKTA